MHLDLAGQVAVVTGGANGIGGAIVQALREAGATTWVLDREREIDGLGSQALAVDVTQPDTLEAAFRRIGSVDIVVANAGVVTEAPLTETAESDWRRILDVNLTGVFHTVQQAARLMKPRRSGSIVLTASTNSYDGEARLTAYNASKAGLLGLLHTASNELGPYQIRVNAVCPGLIRTRLTEGHFGNPAILRDYFRHIPLGRGGLPVEVAKAVLFLASPWASYITGASLFVDGGQMASKFATWNDEKAVFRHDHWELENP